MQDISFLRAEDAFLTGRWEHIAGGDPLPDQTRSIVRQVRSRSGEKQPFGVKGGVFFVGQETFQTFRAIGKRIHNAGSEQTAIQSGIESIGAGLGGSVHVQSGWCIPDIAGQPVRLHIRVRHAVRSRGGSQDIIRSVRHQGHPQQCGRSHTRGRSFRSHARLQKRSIHHPLRPVLAFPLFGSGLLFLLFRQCIRRLTVSHFVF